MSDVTVIRPRKGWVGINLQELWRYRELLYIFVWRDIKVRYKQTVIGIAWAVLQPFLLMVVFTVFFGSLIKVPSDGIPYGVFVYAGLLFWNYFSTALTNASNSLIENENILKKIYFPRLILPLSPTLTPVVDFLFAALVYAGILTYYSFSPVFTSILITPLLLLLSWMTAYGLGTLFASMNVRYRDLRYALPFFIQLLLFLTPVIYPVTLIGEKYRWIMALNPMTGIIDTARAALLGNRAIDWPLLGISSLIACALLGIGLFTFRRAERTFADVA